MTVPSLSPIKQQQKEQKRYLPSLQASIFNPTITGNNTNNNQPTPTNSNQPQITTTLFFFALSTPCPTQQQRKICMGIRLEKKERKKKINNGEVLVGFTPPPYLYFI